MTAGLFIPDRELEPEGNRLAVNPVRPADHDRAAVLIGPLLQHAEERLQILEDDVQHFRHLNRQRGVHNVGRRQS